MVVGLKKRMQPRVFGHKAGMDALRTVICCCWCYGRPDSLCLLAESWIQTRRIKFIMNLPVGYTISMLPQGFAPKNFTKIQMIGKLIVYLKTGTSFERQKS